MYGDRCKYYLQLCTRVVQQSSTPHLRGVGGDEDEREEAEDQVKDVAADRLGLDDDGVLDHLQFSTVYGS